MKTFLNLRLSARLGAAFGFLVLAPVVTAVVGLDGLAKVNDRAEQISDRDVAALEELVTISEDFLAGGYLLLRHLYVEDGDLRAQDRTAGEIEKLTAEADETMAALAPRLEGADAERVSEIAGAVQQISAEFQRAEGGISEVAAVAEQSSASAEQVSASTQETSASTQEIASSAAELARTAEQLDRLVRRFKVSA